MVQVKHVSFKDWNPIGRPRQRSVEQTRNLSSIAQSRISEDAGSNPKSTSTTKDPYEIAAILELTHRN